MPDRPALTPESAPRADEQMPSGDGSTRLIALLERHEPTDPAVVEARAALAVDVARAGRLDEALYQVDELVKDCLRAHGPDHAAVAVAEDAQATVRALAGFEDAERPARA